MTLHQPGIKSSVPDVTRKVPLDIRTSREVFGGGAFARTCSLVYSQLKYWWKYAKHKFDNKIWFYKSQRELSEELGMSEKTIWRAIKRLRELGLVLVEKHHKRFYRQVYFYHLCYFPEPKTSSGGSQLKSKSNSHHAVSKPPKREVSSSKNDGIQHKKNNPLKEIIRRATQHRTEVVGFGGGEYEKQPRQNRVKCSDCRDTGLIENARNIAIRCSCEAGNKYQHILPIVGDVKLSVA